jgi:predicted phage tail protein
MIIQKGKNTDDAMKKLKKAVADFVAQVTELELSINGSKCAILIFGKQKTKETIVIEKNRRELQIPGNHDRPTIALRIAC